MEIASAESIREAEQQLFRRGGISSLELMNLVITRMSAEWKKLRLGHNFTHVLIYAGSGNNAGDAIGFAATLGLPITLRQVSRLSLESKAQHDLLPAVQSEITPELRYERLLIIDGLLGTGMKEPLNPIYCDYVREINSIRESYAGSYVVSMDIPSGLNADTGKPFPLAVKADMTMCIGCVKTGMLADTAHNYVGRILPIDLPEIDIPRNPNCVLDRNIIHTWLPQRPYNSYKNIMGHVGIIAGSVGYLGAAQLCAEAALAAGAGLVTLYCYEKYYSILASRLAPEIIVRPIKSYHDVRSENHESMVIGPGIGTPSSDEGTALYRIVAQTECPTVLDADGINLAAAEKWQLSEHIIATPHLGEMRTLMGEGNSITCREDWIDLFHQRHHGVVLFKGERSIIASSNRRFYNSTGGPYMANGGQGDALSGCIAGLAAQGMVPLTAAAAGSWLCGLAAERAYAAQQLSPSIRASQMIAQLPNTLAEL